MKLILIVDDSESVRNSLKFLLSKDYIIVEASDGIKAKDYIESTKDKIDLMITDLNMPRLDGLGMLEQLKKQDLIKFPVFILSTESNPELKAKGKECGVTAWVVKPFRIPVMLAAVKKLLDEKSEPNG